MFWKFDLHTTSHIDQLLDREDVTLRELMEEDDVLQECKAQNRRLLLFLSQEHCMQELVSLITTEPPADLEERSRFKFPNIACELLTSDVSIINDKLGGEESLLEMLYHFLEQDPPLNPLLASFFSKTIGNLIARKTEQVITFLKKKEGFIGLVLKHIDASAMMDLLLRLISCVEPAPLRQEVLHWLNEENLVQRLTELIHTGKDEERQSNASQTLCDIIRLSRDQANQMQENMEADPLLAVLESQESVAGLLKNLFEGERSEASIVNGTQVLLTLLETRRSGLEGLMDLYSQGYERSYTVNSSILNAIEPHLKDFQQLLLDPPKVKPAILTTVGVLEQPLGNARLHVARLVAALLQTNAPSMCQELCNLGTMDLLLDLFFKYSWNNFLHFQVELSVAAILNHPSSEERPCPGLQNHDGTKCRLVQRILDAWEENDRIQAEGGTRRGNMGHLTRIANMVVQNLEKGPVQAQITDLIKELPEDCRGRWESFVDETLRETNRRNTVELVRSFSNAVWVCSAEEFFLFNLLSSLLSQLKPCVQSSSYSEQDRAAHTLTVLLSGLVFFLVVNKMRIEWNGQMVYFLYYSWYIVEQITVVCCVTGLTRSSSHVSWKTWKNVTNFPVMENTWKTREKVKCPEKYYVV
uniref:Protein phosphatase 6 regulatory subunit 2 n=1 Tax=Scophthalmus maximus TaxID=52904 RepID=A0A8D3BN93_SCOMX